MIIDSQACIERLARAVLGGVLVGRAWRPEEDRSVTASPASLLSRTADVVAGGLFEPRAPWLTGFGVCPGPRAPHLAASLRKGVVAEGLDRLGADDVPVLELAVSTAQAIALEAAEER